eukprot:GEMP01025142.1.p1 GENE.GEMP01025142.1~~GEMP01025142.1.p1  ORF type:complete len:696 (+),score=184.40 GEMP01025142.1:109-2196(+)
MKFFGALTLLLALGEDMQANPIRKVVNMLQNMQKKVTEESEKEANLYDKFVCYCKANTGDLTKAVAEAQGKIAQLESQIDQDTGAKIQVDEELRDHKASRKEAQEALGAATKLREKEAEAYAKESGDQGTNIEALKSAITAISEGMGGSFVQTTAGERFKNMVVSSKVAFTEVNRDMITLFLSNSENAPASSEIVGILKEMREEMKRDLGGIVEAEEQGIAAFEQLASAKRKEIAAATKAIEEKTERSGRLAVSIVEAKADLKDTMAALSQDEQFQVNLRRTCEQKEHDFTERNKVRSEESKAIAETITILNDDDALDLFKKTLPGPGSSFLQSKGVDNVRKRAKNIINQVAKTYRNNKFDFIALALSGKKVDFSKVIFMVEDMVKLLGKEQINDDAHREYCNKEFDTSDDKKGSIQRDITARKNTLEQSENASKNLASEIATLQAGIKELDKQVAAATEQRKQEHAEFVQSLSENQAAVEILAFAKNRLQKFYNPKLHKGAPKRELSEQEQIYTKFGGKLEPTPAPGGIAGSGVTVFLQREAPLPAPDTWGAYKKKGAESGGVLAMIDMLVNDVKKEIHEAELTEKDSQEDYEGLMSDSKKKRALDSKSITTNESSKAESDTIVEQTKEALRLTNADLKATEEFIGNLHKSCDFLLGNYDFRKAAREQETEALKNAKAVLQGANYSLIQKHVDA